MTSLIGRRLGRYEIRAELGRGGMARVYSALDTQLQRTVAIKVLAAQLSMDEEFVRRFEREARTAASLRHPSLVTIYDVGEQDGLHFIAMEYVAGRSLHTILEERTALGLGFAVSILEPVAQALDYAHSQGAVHRDIKPHNILIDRSGRVLLTDFGIAQTAEADSERLTRTGVFMGTPEYISPEQAEARRVDGRSDLYSLGVVAYEIVTGRVPFSGATPQLIVAHAQLPPPPPTAVAAYLPGELDEVLTRALAKRPERRYPSGAALVEALGAVARRYSTPLASRDQIAALALGAEAGGPAPAHPPAPAPARDPRPALPPPPRPLPSGPRPQPAERPARPQPADPPRTGPTRPQPTAGRPATAGQRPPAPRAYPPDTLQRRLSGGAPVLLIGVLLVALTLALIFAVARGLANPIRFPTPQPTLEQPTTLLQGTALPIPEPTATPSDTPTSEPTNTPAELPTVTPEPEPTLAPPPSPAPARPSPTLAPPPSDTPAPPTATPELPTDTPELPTDTPELPTDTPAPPTPTPTPTDEPTVTAITETSVLSETAIPVTPIVEGG